jgi:hypothetical protein
MASVQDRVAERWPDLLPLLRHPEIGKLLTQAVEQQWSPGVFQSKFRASNWFRSQPQSSREWWVLKAMDPGEAKTRMGAQAAGIRQQAGILGIALTEAEVKYMADAGIRLGIAPDSPQAIHGLLQFGRTNKNRMKAGAYNTARRAVANVAVGTWLRPLDATSQDKWGYYIAMGQKTLDDFNESMARDAGNRYPHMRDQIRAGMTTSEIVQPMVEAYAREMDWDARGLMSKLHTNPQFGGLLGIKDPKTGKMRLPTEYESTVMARQRSDWAATTSGREKYAAMGNSLLQAFGKRV